MSNSDSLPKVGLSQVKRTILMVVFGVFLFLSGYYFGVEGFKASFEQYPKVNITRTPPPEHQDVDFALFWNIWDTMHSKYYDKSKVIDSELVYGAIRGMVAAVGDPYTVFLPPKQNKLVEEDLKGSFEGVGIQIGFKKGQLAVIAPLPNSPAEKAGIMPGDYIVQISDSSRNIDVITSGISLEQAVEHIRGKAGTKVTLTLVREGDEEPQIKEVERASIDVPSLIVEYPNGSNEIAHIKLVKFTAETVAEWDETVAHLVSNPNLKTVILDLRNNPGGYLQGAVDIASDFLETGDLVVKESGASGINHEYKVTKLGRLRTVELIVLVNEGSASASEIFAGAMKDHGRALIVGDKTFGKGTIQEPEQVEGGAGLHITIAKWLTPEGEWVHDNGLEPDELLENNPDTEEDEQLQKAIEIAESN